ncbi:uncharacterized protein LOC144674479 [Cetorhinus maximus]
MGDSEDGGPVQAVDQASPPNSLSGTPFSLGGKESSEGKDKELRKAEIRKNLKKKKETGSETSCTVPPTDDLLQATRLPILAGKPSKTECRNEFQKKLRRNKECTPLSTVIIRWSVRKDMPDTLYRWFILQELCKYGPIDSVIFYGHRCAQVVFSDMLSACKAINTHSVRLPGQLYNCFWYYPFMMQNYRF